MINNKRKVFLVLFLSIMFCSLHAQNKIAPAKKTSLFEVKTSLFKQKPVLHFKFKINSKEEIYTLTRIISIDNVANNEVFAYANEKEFNKFLSLGYNYEIIDDEAIIAANNTILPETKMATLGASLGFQPMTTYPTYTAYDSTMLAFGVNYPNICKIINIKTLASGRQLLFAKISKNPNVKQNEPTFLYTSTMHGDEPLGYVLMLDLINYLLSNYGIDPRVTRIIDSTELWINPLANPDGTYAGGNTTLAGATRTNANGVDLNRNYPDIIEGLHPDGNVWQDETIAFMGLADSINFTMSTNFHTGSQVCNYPWDCMDSLTADDSWWQYVCHEWADTAQFYGGSTYMNSLNDGITDGYAWYLDYGGRQDYMNYWHHCREFTCELSSVKQPSKYSLATYWTWNLPSFLNYIEQCQYGIRGNITDSLTGKPLQAEVYISGFDKDSSEVYSFMPFGNYYRHIIAGTYNVTYSAPCYISKTISTTVFNLSAINQNVQLMPVVVNAGADVTKMLGDSVLLNPTTNYQGNAINLTWSWSPATGLSNASIKNPIAKPNTTTNYVVKLTSIEGCSASDTIQITILQSKTLNVTAKLQGYYISGFTTMNQAQDVDNNGNNFNKWSGSIVDTLTVQIRSTLAPYYMIEQEFYGSYLNTDGTITLSGNLQSNITGYQYIVIKHWKSIETWSDSVDFTPTVVNYNFFTKPASTQFPNNMSNTDAYGNLVEGNLIWAGDITNGNDDVLGEQDGYVTLDDVFLIYDANLVLISGYNELDINGDGYVTLDDVFLAYNNNLSLVQTVNPITLNSKKK